MNSFKSFVFAKVTCCLLYTSYINDEEYNSLFMKGNYQSTVYIDERKNADEAVSWLKKNGYTVISLAKAKTQFIDTDILDVYKRQQLHLAVNHQ